MAVLKILVVTEDLKLGGAQTMSLQLANALAERPGIEVSFAASNGPLRERLSDRISYFETPLLDFRNIFPLYYRLRAALLQSRSDVVHAQSGSMGTIAKLAAMGLNKQPRMILTHHSRVTWRLPNSIGKIVLNGIFDHLIAVSKEKHADLQGISAHKLSLIPNFIDVEEFGSRIASLPRNDVRRDLGIACDAAVLTIAGRLIPQKGFHRFIRMVELIAGKFCRPVAGIILGDGEAKAELEETARKTARLSQILFLGYQKDVYKYLGITDIFLFPTLEHELLPMVLIEAGAAGVPVVCSRMSGNDDIIADGINGFLVDGDDDAFSEKILQILNNKQLAEEMSSRGISIARARFDRTVIIDKLLNLYRTLTHSNNIGVQ